MNDTEYKPLKISDWIVSLILLIIPLVNIIMLIVWAASSSLILPKKVLRKLISLLSELSLSWLLPLR